MGPKVTTEFGEIAQNNAHYAVQGHSRLPTLVPIESSYICDFLLVINTTCLLSFTISKLWPIIGQIFACGRGVPHFNAVAAVIPC